MPDIKVAIATPHLERSLPAYWVDCLFATRPGDGVKQTALLRVEAKPLDIARTGLAKLFLQLEEGSYTHVLWIDSDMKWPPTLLQRLLAHDLPIVSATYFQRTDLPQPHAYRYVKADEKGHWYTPLARELTEWMHRHEADIEDKPNAWAYPFDDGLYECDAIGFGAVLIKREVFEKTPEPWFDIDLDSGGGEDFCFCRQAKAAGFPIYVDFALQCDHGTRTFVGMEDFAAAWGFGTEDECPWDTPQVTVHVNPNGRKYIPDRKWQFEPQLAVGRPAAASAAS